MTKFFFLIISCFILWGIASCKNEGGVIKGEILNLDSPYILASYFAADSLVIDTISVGNKGKFKYPIDVDTLTTFSLYLNDYESAAVVFADEDQKLTVKGDARFSDLIRINGNDINDDLTSFKTENQELLMQRGQLLNNQREVNENDTSFNSSINRHEEMGKLNSLNHELTLKAEERIKENPTKLSSLILISNFFMNSDNFAALERVLGYLQGDVTKTAMAVSLNAYSDKLSRSAEGESMPYFQLTDDEGNRIQSSDFSGKYVLLSFISTTGIKSRETVELLKNAYDHLQRDSVEFITIYIDSESHPVEYVESDSIPWTVVAEKRSWGADIVDNYNVQYVPFNILISPDRTIQVRNIAAQGIVDEIKKSSENLIITDLE